MNNDKIYNMNEIIMSEIIIYKVIKEKRARSIVSVFIFEILQYFKRRYDNI